MGRPTAIPDDSPLTPLLTHAGGVLLLAAATGLGRSTIARAAEREPSVLARRALNDYARHYRLRLPYPRSDRAR